MADWKVRRIDEDPGLQLGERRVQWCRAHASRHQIPLQAALAR
jgi:hypothetical protein